MGLQKIRQDWATNTFTSPSDKVIWEQMNTFCEILAKIGKSESNSEKIRKKTTNWGIGVKQEKKICSAIFKCAKAMEVKERLNYSSKIKKIKKTWWVKVMHNPWMVPSAMKDIIEQLKKPEDIWEFDSNYASWLPGEI